MIGVQNTSSASPNFVVRDGTLYRRVWSKNRNEEHHVIVIPAAFRAEILRAVQGCPDGGIIGQCATLRKVQERFWWPRMHSQIRSYVDGCEVSQRYKRIPGSQPGLFSPITPPEAVFNTIGIDQMGPLPTTAAGNRYIIVAVDYLSKYVEVAAVPSLATSHVIEFLKTKF